MAKRRPARHATKYMVIDTVTKLLIGYYKTWQEAENVCACDYERRDVIDPKTKPSKRIRK